MIEPSSCPSNTFLYVCEQFYASRGTLFLVDIIILICIVFIRHVYMHLDISKFDQLVVSSHIIICFMMKRISNFCRKKAACWESNEKDLVVWVTYAIILSCLVGTINTIVKSLPQPWNLNSFLSSRFFYALFGNRDWCHIWHLKDVWQNFSKTTHTFTAKSHFNDSNGKFSTRNVMNLQTSWQRIKFASVENPQFSFSINEGHAWLALILKGQPEKCTKKTFRELTPSQYVIDLEGIIHWKKIQLLHPPRKLYDMSKK